MATDRERVKSLMGSQYASNADIEDNAGDGKVVASELWRRSSLSAILNDNVTAATNVAEFGFFQCKRPCRLKSANIIAGINVAAHASNYVTFTLSKRTAGGAATALATWNTNSSAQGALQEWNAHSMVLTATTANLDIAANDVLTIKAVKAASGQAICGGTAGVYAAPCPVAFVDLEEI